MLGCLRHSSNGSCFVVFTSEAGYLDSRYGSFLLNVVLSVASKLLVRFVIFTACPEAWSRTVPTERLDSRKITTSTSGCSMVRKHFGLRSFAGDRLWQVSSFFRFLKQLNDKVLKPVSTFAVSEGPILLSLRPLPSIYQAKYPTVFHLG